MHQKSFHPHRVTVKDVALFIRADVHSFDENFAVINTAPGIFQIDPSGTDRLDLGSEKLDPGFVGFEDKIIVISFFVLCHPRQVFVSRHKITPFQNDACLTAHEAVQSTMKHGCAA